VIVRRSVILSFVEASCSEMNDLYMILFPSWNKGTCLPWKTWCYLWITSWFDLHFNIVYIPILTTTICSLLVCIFILTTTICRLLVCMHILTTASHMAVDLHSRRLIGSYRIPYWDMFHDCKKFHLFPKSSIKRRNDGKRHRMSYTNGIYNILQ
jgi:hypothetical protein